MIDLAPSQKFPKNAGDLGKLLVAKACKRLHKVLNIAKSGHTDLKLIFESKAIALL